MDQGLVAAGAEATIRVVGGAAVALQVGREALTGDVDALYGSSPAVRAAADRIAQARNWPTTWLNDAVKMYTTHFDTDGDWEVHNQHQAVAILVAQPPLLLAMKLRAGRGRRDAEDIERLLEACHINSVDAAIAIFDRYYPQDAIAEVALRQLQDRFE